MSHAFSALCALATISIGSAALAADGPDQPPPTRQQQLEHDCNQVAIGKSGLERFNVIRACRNNGVHAAIVNPAGTPGLSERRRKTRDCNAQANMRNLSGASRTTFVNICVSN